MCDLGVVRLLFIRQDEPLLHTVANGLVYLTKDSVRVLHISVISFLLICYWNRTDL